MTGLDAPPLRRRLVDRLPIVPLLSALVGVLAAVEGVFRLRARAAECRPTAVARVRQCCRVCDWIED